MPVPEPRLSADTLARPEIAASWRRAELAGLQPDSPLDRVTVADVDRTSRLMVAAGPVLDGLMVQLEDTALCVALADHTSRIVDLRFTERRVGEALERINAIRGSRYSEETSGTNAIATPHVTRAGITINGAEHYLEPLKVFSCYGQPIRHPVTRRLEGVLDITGMMPRANPLFAPVVQRTVSDIEQRLLGISTRSEQNLLAAFRAAAGHSRAVVVLGDNDVVLANPLAVDLLEAGDHALLRTIAPDVHTGRDLVREIILASGRAMQARLQRIEDARGTLVQLEPVEPRSVQRGWHPPSTDTGSTTLVCGEPGSGRSTAVREIAGDEPLVTMDAALVATLKEQEWARRLERQARTHRGVLAVENVHLLPPSLAVWLSRLLDDVTARVVLTSAPREQLTGDVASLAATCVSAVELRPLRHRRDELPALVRSMLAELRPDAGVRFTTSALAALAAHDWPGNLRELHAVVRHAVEQRSTGDITVRDLPPSHRADPKLRTLTPWEQAEHDAIVTALRATSGNKARAAKRLGISRSTLYNRIRVLRISV